MRRDIIPFLKPLRLAAYCSLAIAPTLASASDAYVLRLEYETTSQSLAEPDNRSSSRGHQTLSERPIRETAAGTEIEYAPPGPPEEVRDNASWMFPLRLLVTSDGRKTVLNPEQLETRLTAWLEKADWSREVCSKWLFTWIAIQVRCDPGAAIEAVETFGMRPGQITEGAQFEPAGALVPVVLTWTGFRDGRMVLSAVARIDPQFVRAGATETALVVAQISGEDLSAEDAALQAAGIGATGTLTVEFEVDEAGLIWKRVDTSEIVMTGGNNGDEVRRSSQTVTRFRSAEWNAREGS